MERELNRSIAYDRLWQSYLRLRGLLGLLGLLLPVVLLVWGMSAAGPIDPPLHSISDYYHQNGMGHFFVGTLMAIGFFLAAYKGYDRTDDLAGWLAGAFALGVAFFPNWPQHTLSSTLHFVFAAGLFLVLSFFSVFLFTKTKPKEDLRWQERILGLLRSIFSKNSSKKDQRNKAYVICGLVMLGLMAFYALFKLSLYVWSENTVLQAWDDSRLLFWIESLMLWAFGSSWVIKGSWLWLLNDRDK